MTLNQTETVVEIYSFGDLVDITDFSEVLQRLFKATGIPNCLVGPDGGLITQAGWSDACALFHRVNPETNRLCEESNLELMRMIREGSCFGCLCKNGLYDYATPVVVEGRQLATLFLGQVIDKPPDLGFFRDKAKQFGFDEEEYLKAIRTVPIVSKAQMERYMESLAGVAQVLASSGLAKLREKKLQQDLSISTERRIHMEDLLESCPVGISWCDAEGKFEYVNRQFTEMFGYTLDDLPDIKAWIGKAYPDAGYRKAVVESWEEELEQAHQSVLPPSELESNITCKDGRKLRVMTRVTWVGEKRLANFTDISAHWQSALRDHAHNAMLVMVAKAEPLTDILDAIVHTVEEEAPASLCSVLLLNDEGERLYSAAAPSLPAFYNREIDGLEIGMGVGSCGSVAYLGERVIVKNISTQQYCQPFVELAKRAGLVACWSEPILASDGKVLGSFIIYHSQPATPNTEDIERITFAANLAAIAIENRNTREALLRREREFRTLAENAPINIARYDVDGRLIYLNPRFANTLALPEKALLGKKPVDWPDSPNLDNMQRAVNQTARSGEEFSLEIEVPVKDGGMQTHILHMMAERDATGAVVGVLATGQDISERKQLEQKLAEQENEFRTLAENMPINIARFNLDGRLIYNNSKHHTCFPLPIEKILGIKATQGVSQPYVEIIEKSVLQTLQSGVERSFEIEIPVREGNYVTYLITMVAERDTSGTIGVLATGLDISERKQLQRELERQARRDFLTGLYNRRYFIELAKKELSRLKRYGGELSLIMFDIDFFKQINDTYGHTTGDIVLQKIAKISRDALREVDIVGRLGGEEFVVLLPQTNRQQALEAAERLRLVLEAGVVKLENGTTVLFTASLGVLTVSLGKDRRSVNISIDDLLNRVDKALYKAKQSGRNRVYQSQ
jgi:diguanylate cyclase (GGDEF)-like protein/PAS domain S-box-containing protein